MRKEDINKILSVCLDQKKYCGVLLQYDTAKSYYYPLLMSDTLFLGAAVYDFELDGYSIQRIEDITNAQLERDMFQRILDSESIADHISTPDVDLTSWETSLRSLQQSGRNIIIREESINKDERSFYIGRIENIHKGFVYFRHFDADGIWMEDPYKITYSNITSITFASRYVEIFSKYVGKPLNKPKFI